MRVRVRLRVRVRGGVRVGRRVWVRVRVRVSVKSHLPLLKNGFFGLVREPSGSWEFFYHPRIGLGPADLLKKCGAPGVFFGYCNFNF